MTPDPKDMDERTRQSNVRTSLALIRTIDAEKRTHLAELRTGIGILTIPMSLLTILIATSNYYSVDSVLSFVFGLVLGIIALSSVGAYLVIRSLQKIKATEKLRKEFKDISCLLEEHKNSD
ncbi:MAG: hypothetical protein MUP60_04815 [Candidatus Thorarchaeota archaeon]|nr:hypothetical protein [Candidatus Thorarchaeota archaeon]